MRVEGGREANWRRLVFAKSRPIHPNRDCSSWAAATVDRPVRGSCGMPRDHSPASCSIASPR